MEGQAKASTAIKKVTKSTRNMNDAVLKARRELRKLKESQTASAKAAKKLAAANKKLAVSTKGMVNQFIKVNLASRGISKGIQLMTQAFAAGITASINFEYTMAKISAISNVTGHNLARLEGTIKAIAKASPKTGTEVAAAALEMSKMGLAGQDLEDSLEGVVNLSVALDENVAAVGQTLVNVKNVFQKDASEMNDIADKMFTTLGNSALNLEKFGTAFSFAGAGARLAGVSFEELSGMMGVLADNGVKASTIGTQLRKVLTNLDDPTSKVSKLIGANSIQNLGLAGTFEVLSEAINNSGDAKKLFGRTAISVIDILSRSGEEMGNLTEKIVDMEKSTRSAADALGNTFQGKLDKVASAWENMFTSMGNSEVIKASLGSIADDMNKLSDSTVGWMKKYSILWRRFTPVGSLKQIWNDLWDASAAKKAAKSLNAVDKARESLEKWKTLAGPNGDDFNMTSSTGLSGQKTLAIQEAKAQMAKNKADEIALANKEKLKKSNKKIADDKAKADKEAADRAAKDKKSFEDAHAVWMEKEKEKIALAKKKSDGQKSIARYLATPQEREIMDLEDSRDAILATESITASQRLAVHEKFIKDKEKLTDKHFRDEILNVVDHAQTVSDALLGFTGALSQLGQVQTDNAVKRAEAEGKSEAQIQAIRKKGFESQKKYLYLQAAMQTALGVARAFGDHAAPYSFIVGGLVGAAGLAQMATINQQKMATGFEGTVTQPTSIMVGEEGAEDVMVKPRSKTGKASGSGGNTVIIQGDVYGEEKFMEAVRTANENLERSTI